MEDDLEITQADIDEVSAKAQVTVDIIAPDPRIQELEAKVSLLESEAETARVLIEKLRSAKNGYKAVAAQGIQEVIYMNKYAPHNYIQRRLTEFPAEFAAVQDVE